MICKGFFRILIRLFQISYKYGICFLVTGKCNFIVVLGWGICTLFKPHCGVFVWTAWPTVGHLQHCQKKKKLQMPMSVCVGGGRGGGDMGPLGIDWVITSSLLNPRNCWHRVIIFWIDFTAHPRQQPVSEEIHPTEPSKFTVILLGTLTYILTKYILTPQLML